jgi:hypothetical protein
MDDLHRAFRLRRGVAVALWPVPADGRLRPHLYFEPDRHFLHRHVGPLLLAHPRHCARGRDRAALPRDPLRAGRDKSTRGERAGAAGRPRDRSYPQPRDQGRDPGRGAHRPDAVAALAGRSAARLQRLRRVRLRHADEARPARHDHRLHHHAGADRRPRRRRQGRDEILDGPDERRHGGGDVHDARRAGRLDPGPDSILHARCRDPAGILRCRDADRDARHAGAGAASGTEPS